MDPYIPSKLPPADIDWASHVTLIGKSNAALARYDGTLKGIVNPDILLSPLATREAVLSSRIEGTQASLEEVLEYEADSDKGISSEKKADIQEIINYRHAMRAAVNELKERPIGINMLRNIHRILLTSVRGRNKEPGEIRHIQNWIGPSGTPLEQATFVPPEPSLIMDALTDWEYYLHREDRDTLVQLAILKAQFELIHPFRDGNGRIGRMLVPLILYHKKLIGSPVFYISAYFEQNRDIYYDRLELISLDGDWNLWIGFFLQAVIEQAEDNSQKATAILDLYNEMKYRVAEIAHTQYAIKVVDTIFSQPVFRAADFPTLSGIPKDSSQRLLRELREEDIIRMKVKGSGRRSAVYEFPGLLRISGGV
jgi:Fic family protein